MKKVFLTTAVSAAFVVAAPVALAETASPAPLLIAQAVPADVGATGTQRSERRFRMPSERVEARLAYLKTALNIVPSQEAEWEQFANVLRNQAREMDQRIEQRRAQRAQQPREARTFTAIERLELRQQRMQAGAARLNEVIAAAKPLYAVLSPEQQQVADQVIGQRAGKGRHHHRGGMQRG